DFRSHVVNGAYGLRLRALLRSTDELAQSIITYLHHAVLDEDVGRLEITVNDATFMQRLHSQAQFPKDALCLFSRQSLRIPIQHLVQTLTSHVLHDDPVIALIIGLDVVQRNEVLMLEVDALLHATEFDLGIATNEL